MSAGCVKQVLAVWAAPGERGGFRRFKLCKSPLFPPPQRLVATVVCDKELRAPCAAAGGVLAMIACFRGCDSALAKNLPGFLGDPAPSREITRVVKRHGFGRRLERKFRQEIHEEFGMM